MPVADIGDPDKWISEEASFEGIGFVQSFQIKKKLFDEMTEYQHLQVFETMDFGNLMVLDGVFQSTEADEFCYHEMQAHVPLFAHPNPKRVLIVGGGDGGVAREVLKHPSVEEVHLVDIDKRVTDIARIYFKKIASALDDPRLQIIHEDGAIYVEQEKFANYFDIICIDSSDPIGPNKVLFREAFYANVHRCLADSGIAVAQGECMWLHPRTIKSVLKATSKIFPKVDYYWHLIPVYPCGTIGMIAMMKNKDTAVNRVHPLRLAAAEEISSSASDDRLTKYYNPQIHVASFVKPNFFLRNLPVLATRT